MVIDALGIAWYRAEDYDRLKAMFVDGDELPDTYEEWLKKAREVVGVMTLDRQPVEKIWIDPIAFPKWCSEHGQKLDASARTRYAAEAARAISRERHQADLTRK